MPKPDIFDIAVVGAGPAGLTAALLAAQSGLRVALLGPTARQDFRTSALMTGNVDVLGDAGVWERCAAAAAPLEHLRIVDDTGRLLRAPEYGLRRGDVEASPADDRTSAATSSHGPPAKYANAASSAVEPVLTITFATPPPARQHQKIQ